MRPAGTPHAQPFDRLAAEPARHPCQPTPGRERIIAMALGSPGASIRDSQLAANGSPTLTLKSNPHADGVGTGAVACAKPTTPNTFAANPHRTPAEITQKAISDRLPLSASR